jgi:hypothetical protein
MDGFGWCVLPLVDPTHVILSFFSLPVLLKYAERRLS